MLALVLPWPRLRLFGHAAGHLVGLGVFPSVAVHLKGSEVEGNFICR